MPCAQLVCGDGVAERGPQCVAGRFDGAAGGAETAARADGAAAALAFGAGCVFALDAALALGGKLVESALDVVGFQLVELLGA